MVNYFQSKTENQGKSIGAVSQEPVSNDVAKIKYPQDGVKVPKEAFGPAAVVLKEAFNNCKHERHILVTLESGTGEGEEITQGKNFNRKCLIELEFSINFTEDVKMITDCIRQTWKNFEVSNYGFAESKTNTDTETDNDTDNDTDTENDTDNDTEVLKIIEKMNDSCSSTVLVAHADVCRGFEWPTVIRVNL